jgi:hypothetical protein
MFFVRAYPRETQEMVFDAHDRAFAFSRHLRQSMDASRARRLVGSTA